MRVIVRLSVAVVLLVAACAPARTGPGTAYDAQAPLRAVDGAVWLVGGDVVTLAPDAAVVGSPTVGAIVKVSGTRDQDGWPVARRAEVVQAADVAPIPVPPTTTASAPTGPAPTPTARAVAPAPAVAPPATAEPAVRPAGPPGKPEPPGRAKKKERDD